MTAGKHWPIDPNTPVTSPFGYRGGFAVPGSADWLAGLHDGTDFGADYGTPVYAAHAGTLTNRLDPGGYGQYVQIDADGIMTQYGHVRDMWIIPDGTWVEPGTWIAGVGSEGMSTGAHLHFRLHLDGQATDPVPWLQDAEWHPGVTTAQPAEAAAYVPTTNEGHVVRWLLDHTGWTPAGVAGVCGNIQQESSFNPTITEGGRAFDQLDRTRAGATAAGFGLCQWSFDDEWIDGKLAKGRLWGRDGLINWATARTLDYTTIDTQLQFMRWEIANYWPDLDTRLAAATDPYEASKDFGAVFEGFNPAYEGPRNQYAVDIYPRIMAGEFGPTTPTQPTPPAIPLAAIATALDTTIPGGTMSAVVVYLVGPRPENCPEVWLNMGHGFKPVRGTEPDFAQPTVANIKLSWGDFQPHLQQSLADHEDNLDGSADLGPRRIRYAVARAAAVAAGLDPDKVAAG